MNSSQKRGSVSRKNIYTFIGKDRDREYSQCKVINISKTLSKTYSGFLHGASPQIMELYLDNPPSFQLLDTKESYIKKDSTDCLYDFYYNALWSFFLAAKAFGEDKLCNEIVNFSELFVVSTGRGNDFRETSQ